MKKKEVLRILAVMLGTLILTVVLPAAVLVWAPFDSVVNILAAIGTGILFALTSGWLFSKVTQKQERENA